MADEHALPDSLKLYFTDRQVKDGVDYFAAAKGDAKEDQIREWADVPLLGRAWVSAQICMADWFVFMDDLFNRQFTPVIESLGWTSLSVIHQRAAGWELPTPRRSWDDDWAGHCFSHASAHDEIIAGFYIYGNPDGFFPVVSSASFARKSDLPPGWEFDGNDLEPCDVIAWNFDGGQDIRKLQQQCREAVLLTNSLLV